MCYQYHALKLCFRLVWIAKQAFGTCSCTVRGFAARWFIEIGDFREECFSIYRQKSEQYSENLCSCKDNQTVPVVNQNKNLSDQGDTAPF